MANYLKKTKMKKILESITGYKFVLCECNYRKYRGSEWLSVYGSDGYIYELYHSGYISLEVYDYDEQDNQVIYSRTVYTGDALREVLSCVA